MAEIKKELFADDEITLFRVSGKVDVDQIIDELTRFYKENFTNNMIWDFSDAHGRNLSGNDLQMIISHTKEFSRLRYNGKTAFVISSSLGYGLGRMYDSLAQVAEHPVKHSVFRNHDEAVAWIRGMETG